MLDNINDHDYDFDGDQDDYQDDDHVDYHKYDPILGRRTIFIIKKIKKIEVIIRMVIKKMMTK